MRTAFDALERFRGVDATPAIVSEHREVGKGHGRIETRRCVVTDILANPPFEPELWPGLRSIAMIEAPREIGSAVTTERRYYVSSLPPEATRIAHAVRAQWRIENPMHRVLDMAFGEDQCRVRIDNAAWNFAILRRIAMNLPKRDTNAKIGLKNRRLKACINDAYRAQLPGWIPESHSTVSLNR